MEHRNEDLSLTDLPHELVSHILSYVDHRDVASAARSNKFLHGSAENARVEGSDVSFRQLNGEMNRLAGYQPAGFHGSTQSMAQALFAGDPTAMTTAGDLGAGLYLDPTQTAALGRAPDVTGDPKRVYRALTKGTDASHLEASWGHSCENDGVYDEDERDGVKMIQRHVYDKDTVYAPYVAMDGRPDNSPETRKFLKHRKETDARLVPDGPRGARMDPDFLAGIAARLSK